MCSDSETTVLVAVTTASVMLNVIEWYLAESSCPQNSVWQVLRDSYLHARGKTKNTESEEDPSPV
tara:strand:+ start:572 stop:766 length:195 start_codon:yes stop_codon:yes gene_type:complete